MSMPNRDAMSHASDYLLQPHEPAQQTRVSFRWQGQEQFGAVYVGNARTAVVKAMRDLRARAQCGALAAGSWEVCAHEVSDGLKVD